MDGFEDNRGIVVLGATNRPGAIDAALIRPGRFDRIIYMPLPDAAGRAKILQVTGGGGGKGGGDMGKCIYKGRQSRSGRGLLTRHHGFKSIEPNGRRGRGGPRRARARG
jgi:hypothetical protein